MVAPDRVERRLPQLSHGVTRQPRDGHGEMEIIIGPERAMNEMNGEGRGEERQGKRERPPVPPPSREAQRGRQRHQGLPIPQEIAECERQLADLGRRRLAQGRKVRGIGLVIAGSQRQAQKDQSADNAPAPDRPVAGQLSDLSGLCSGQCEDRQLEAQRGSEEGRRQFDLERERQDQSRDRQPDAAAILIPAPDRYQSPKADGESGDLAHGRKAEFEHMGRGQQAEQRPERRRHAEAFAHQAK